MKRSPAASQPQAQRTDHDRRIASACRPSGRPPPDWMADPKLLPKRPPGAELDAVARALEGLPDE